MIEFAASRGAEREPLVRRAALQADDLLDQDRRVSISRYRGALELAADLAQDPVLPLRFGCTVELASMSIVGLLVQACDTFGEALDSLNRYQRLVMEVDLPAGPRFELEQDEDGTWVVDMRISPQEWPELTELTFGQFAGMTRHLGSPPIFRAMHFTHPPRTRPGEYERLLKVPVIFESSRNAMLVDDRRLTQPFARQPRYCFDLFRDRADRLLKELQSPQTMRVAVQRLLVSSLPVGAANVHVVAGKLGVSRQTLFRRLRAEGTSFEQVRDETRRALAFNYLSDRGFTIGEAAYALGFSDRSAFSRAFKRWTGSSPSLVRKA